VEEFEKRRRKIAEMQSKLDNKKCEFESKELKMKEICDAWRPKLLELIKKIDDNFSTFMKSLGCAGEVDLNTPAVNIVSVSGTVKQTMFIIYFITVHISMFSLSERGRFSSLWDPY
jgi:hypothetical protein